MNGGGESGREENEEDEEEKEEERELGEGIVEVLSLADSPILFPKAKLCLRFLSNMAVEKF